MKEGFAMEIKGVKEAVELVEKKTGVDLPDEKIEKTIKQVATKENLEKAKDALGDVVDKLKK